MLFKDIRYRCVRILGLSVFVGVAVLTLGLCFGALAQANYPTRPIKIVVPFAAGGSIDIVPRMVAERLSALLGQPVVIENRPGAGGNLGAEQVFHSEPDGYTILASPMPLLTINQHIYKDMRFDPEKLTPISVLVRYPSVILASSAVPASNLSELIQHAKQNPGRVTYASQGVGTIGHVAFERFGHAVGIKAVHVPYRGNGPAMNDLIAGHVDVLVSDLIAAMPAIQSGRVKLIAVGGDKRLETHTSVPTISETIPGFFLNSWIGLVSAPGTSAEISNKLADAVAKALEDPSLRKKFEQLYSEPAGEGPLAMHRVIERDTKMWGEVVRNANIKLGE